VTTVIPGDKIAWKVISPPPPLSPAEVDALLADWRGSQAVVDVQPLSGGIMNWNYRVRLSGSAECVVLRFYDRMPASCAKEVLILKRLAGDVPVPRVLMATPDGAENYPPFCVLEFMDGISLRELRRRGNADHVQEACYDAGVLLARLRRYPFDRAGLLSSELDVQPGPFDGATVLEVIDHFAARPAFRRRVDSALSGHLGRFCSAAASALGDAEPVCLAHGDFNSPNILVREESGQWRVTAILDWEFAFAGSIWCDVGNMLRYERPEQPRYEPAFSRGLADGGVPLDHAWPLRARLADLPALCELLSRADVPDAIVTELVTLMRETVEP
jgi:aminoglycoside phosphotransferase (APT) family kinase protein